MCVSAFHKNLVPLASGYPGDGDNSFFWNVYTLLHGVLSATCTLMINAEKASYLISFYQFKYCIFMTVRFETQHKRACNNTHTCKYRLAVDCNHLRWWPSRVYVHTCTVILLCRPISHLHKSFVLHNSSCLFQSLMMMIIIINIIIREQPCMYNIHALCKIQYSCWCLLGVISESQFE